MLNLKEIAREIYKLLTSRFGMDEESALDLTEEITDIIEERLE